MYNAVEHVIRVAGDTGFVVALLALPFAFFRKTRTQAGKALICASFAVGASYWVDCLRITYDAFGLVGTILGVGAAGVGVVLASLGHFLFTGQWASFLWFLIGGLLIMAMQLGGWFLLDREKAEI